MFLEPGFNSWTGVFGWLARVMMECSREGCRGCDDGELECCRLVGSEWEGVGVKGSGLTGGIIKTGGSGLV